MNTSEYVSNGIKDAIGKGEYPVGSRLPTINSLSIKYDVAKNTVQVALRDLSRNGYLTRKPNSGYTVRDINEELPTLDILQKDLIGIIVQMKTLSNKLARIREND